MLISLVVKDNEYKIINRAIDEYEAKEYDGWARLLTMKYKDIKKDISDFEDILYNICKENNKEIKESSIIKESINDWIEYLELQDEQEPLNYFNQLIKYSDIELDKEFSIGMIDFIKVNNKEKIHGKNIMKEIEKIFKAHSINKIVLQLLNKELEKYYMKFNYINLKTINNDESRLMFMIKEI
jgi:Glu-tRNA(Gln) amidotransferase subunit E-like FAD-binding protein